MAEETRNYCSFDVVGESERNDALKDAGKLG